MHDFCVPRSICVGSTKAGGNARGEAKAETLIIVAEQMRSDGIGRLYDVNYFLFAVSFFFLLGPVRPLSYLYIFSRI